MWNSINYHTSYMNVMAKIQEDLGGGGGGVFKKSGVWNITVVNW